MLTIIINHLDMTPEHISTSHKLRIAIALFVTMLAISCKTSRDDIIGVWEWKHASDPRYAKVMFYKNHTAVYKISNVTPVHAKWELSGDTLVVQSDNFVWDYVYEEWIFPRDFVKTFDPIYSPDKNGKLLVGGGEYERYILDRHQKRLIPVDLTENGYLQKDSMTETQFELYIPKEVWPDVIVMPYYRKTDIE